jgi:chromosomal replication initiation ATPase DnaA
MTDQFKLIEKTVCEYLGVDPILLKAKTRKREIKEARQYVYYFCKTIFGGTDGKQGQMSQSWIASHYHQDHCSVIHAHKTIETSGNGYRADRERLKDLTELVNNAIAARKNRCR